MGHDLSEQRACGIVVISLVLRLMEHKTYVLAMYCAIYSSRSKYLYEIYH